VVEPHVAELIDDHGSAGELRALQQAVEERGLAAAKKPREHSNRYHDESSGNGAMRSRAGR
jgi:hypothetical protein